MHVRILPLRHRAQPCKDESKDTNIRRVVSINKNIHRISSLADASHPWLEPEGTLTTRKTASIASSIIFAS